MGQIFSPQDADIDLGNGLSVLSVAAAHPTTRHNQHGYHQAVGYMFTCKKHILYAAGDTSVCDKIIDIFRQLLNIVNALLSINVDKYIRRRRCIVGSMSVRGAFSLHKKSRSDKSFRSIGICFSEIVLAMTRSWLHSIHQNGPSFWGIQIELNYE